VFLCPPGCLPGVGGRVEFLLPCSFNFTTKHYINKHYEFSIAINSNTGMYNFQTKVLSSFCYKAPEF